MLDHHTTSIVPGRLSSQGGWCQRLLMDRVSVGVAAFALAAGVIHPPHGLGIPLCWLHSTFGVPCWGCGLSRSLSCSLRGMFVEAWHYHPFGPVIMLLCMAIVALRLLPERPRTHVLDALDSRPRLILLTYSAFVGSFLLFGTWRMLIAALR